MFLELFLDELAMVLRYMFLMDALLTMEALTFDHNILSTSTLHATVTT
jgi:hypothetical protein